jgi:2-oxoglutarate dehydrogenase E1 component
MREPSRFLGANAGYVLELYERYVANPDSVDETTRAYFASGLSLFPNANATSSTPTANATNIEAIVKTARLARLTRERGHTLAQIDPLGRSHRDDTELSALWEEMQGQLASLPAEVISAPLSEGAANALEAYLKLRAAYCGSAGYEDDHIQVAEEREWLRTAIETGSYFQSITDANRLEALDWLIAVDGFEQFLHRTAPYQGQKRFSIEGVDALVPVLEAIVHCAAEKGNQEVVIGMAHRGRLNVLAHVLDKPYTTILSEFATNVNDAVPQADSEVTEGYSGDVKYHKGYTNIHKEEGLAPVSITLAPNPSHLEFVNPVVTGRARAAQDTRLGSGKVVHNPKGSLAIQIHGDAAFPGQGVVPETLNMGGLDGYTVGGTIHIIANNQVGFTTDPTDGRSTLYSSDIARGFEIPIVHVNAEDLDACLAVARMACDYRDTFGKDFLIDLVGYRRWGHNETDEPRFTQPLVYKSVDSHPRPYSVWGEKLVQMGVTTQGDIEAKVAEVKAKLDEAKTKAINKDTQTPEKYEHHHAATGEVVTAVSADRLTKLSTSLATLPEGFVANSKQVTQIINARRDAITSEKPAIHWGQAEILAYASLLEEGIPIRITGQDCERGTFSHRQAVLSDTNTGEKYCALQHLPEAKAAFAIHNSPLSETAVLGFEYGYSVHASETLVLWEAQFGDFANGAQVIIDQFIASGEAKWHQTSGIVLLLPHGYEGQGPEHSSARLERFLQLCAGENLRVANCTSPAQLFHLIRRQAASLKTHPAPLVLMTPKSLLREPRIAVTLAELTSGTFQPVLDDPRVLNSKLNKKAVTRLVLCSGKIYVDMMASPLYTSSENSNQVALVRVEQLNPFPAKELQAIIATYPNLTEIQWVQEEPENMGAFYFVERRTRRGRLLPDGLELGYIGREEEASPAEGKQTHHNYEQKRIVEAALTPTTKNINGNGNGNGTHTAAVTSKKESIKIHG